MTVVTEFSLEVGTYAVSVPVAPDYAAMARELRAEARAWRFVARRAASVRVGASAVGMNFWISEEVRRHYGIDAYGRALARIEEHICADGYTWATSGGVTAEAIGGVVLFDLLLALECEDEARELTAKAKAVRSAKHSTKGSLLKRGGSNA